MAAALGPMDTVIVSKFIKTLSVAEGPPTGSEQDQQHERKSNTTPSDNFKTGTKLMYGGQGKNTNNVNLRPIIAQRNNQISAISLNNGTKTNKGLDQPRLDETNAKVMGEDKRKLRVQNKKRKQLLRATQAPQSQWTRHTGQVSYESTPLPRTRQTYRSSMCPMVRSLNHPAADTLRKWATFGCPTQTGRNWTKEEMWEAVKQGPHWSATTPEALTHFAKEITEKIRIHQARLVPWDDIKDNPPAQLKISPIAAIPHKSKAFRSILDITFQLRLNNRGVLAAVNDTAVKSAPKGAIDQIGECLSRIVHAFAEASEGAKVFMAKWDIKDGFWRMDCQEGKEWNFLYVLPQPEGKPIMIVVPMSLQMGWVESPPYFCTATETARDIATEYTDMPVGLLPKHKFTGYTVGGKSYSDLPKDQNGQTFHSMIEVYVDDFISLVIPVSQLQLVHTATAVITGIHDVFPANDDYNGDDPISEKKLRKLEGQYLTIKTLLGFDFDGKSKKMWLEAAKREKLLTILRGWIRTGHRGTAGIIQRI